MQSGSGRTYQKLGFDLEVTHLTHYIYQIFVAYWFQIPHAWYCSMLLSSAEAKQPSQTVQVLHLPEAKGLHVHDQWVS